MDDMPKPYAKLAQTHIAVHALVGSRMYVLLLFPLQTDRWMAAWYIMVLMPTTIMLALDTTSLSSA